MSPMNSRFFISVTLVYKTGEVVTVFPTSGGGLQVKGRSLDLGLQSSLDPATLPSKILRRVFGGGEGVKAARSALATCNGRDAARRSVAGWVRGCGACGVQQSGRGVGGPDRHRTAA